jgi:hypothetical protein
VSIGPGAESVAVELYASATVDSRWDRAVWDSTKWDAPSWQSVACEVVEADYRYGASADAGVLSVPEAGGLDLRTYDPERLLDPLANGSPFFGSIRPGTPVRLVALVPAAVPAWTGFIDSGSYELGSASGRIRAVDGIAYLAQAEVPDATVLPNTLRARVRAIVAAVGLTNTVPVEPESTDPDAVGDPPVAPFDGKAVSAWTLIQAGALDALTYVWLGPQGRIRFTAWGSLADASYAVGCDDGLGGVWLEGLATLESEAAADPIRNSVRSYSSGTTYGAPLKDAASINRYGERRLDVPRIVPNAAVWAQRIVDDRADAGLEVTLGEVRPYDLIELAALLDGANAGPQVLRVRDDAHGELIDLDVAPIGGAVGVTANGWRWRLVTSIPRADWDNAEPEPPEPPIPPPNPYHTETRTYFATSDALLALTSGGSKYGAGAATTLPVGVWQGWTYRSLIQYPSIPFTGIRRVVSATIILHTTTQVRVGFGSSPTIELRRITGSWSAGSASSPSGSNSVVYPGPAVASTAVRANVTTSQSALVRIAVTPLVLPWAPSSIGGSGAAQRGLAMYPGSGSGADTSEFWPVEQGGSNRPQLEVVVEVFD